LKADAQKVGSIIKGDKAKTEAFCQMKILGKAIDEAIQEKDSKKVGELAQRISAGEEADFYRRDANGPATVARGADAKGRKSEALRQPRQARFGLV
jgi:hypothetical protein